MRCARPIILAVAVLVLAGCSDDQSRERDYAAGVLAAKQSLDEAYTDARPDETTVTGRSSPEEVAALAAAASTAVRDVEALEPPGDLEDSDRRLLAALRQIEKGTAGLAVAAAAKDPSDKVVKRQAVAAREQYVAGTVALEDEIRTLRETR